jgi:hypothetical protein
VAGLTGGRGCRNLVRHDAEQRVTVLTGTRYGDNGRSAVRLSSEAPELLTQLTARK